MLATLPPPAIQQDPPTPGQRPYAPQGGALALLRCRADEVLLEGPSNTGKSRALLEKLYICAKNYPGMRGLIVRKTREALSESTLVTWEDKVLPDGSPIKAGPDRHTRQRYDFPNGSEIVVGGMDKSSKIMSTEYDLIAVFEATELTLTDLESLTTRAHNHVMPYNQVVCDCNPGPTTHWLNERANSGQMVRLLSRHEDNPTCTEDDLRKLRNLTGARRARLYEGRWAAQEGQVYPEWDAAVHIVDRFPIPAEWPRYRVTDFGYTNPFGTLWAATDPDGRLFVYRELYQTGRLVEDMAAEIVRLSAGETITAHPADHDAEDRATLERYGVRTTAAQKDVSPGLQAVAARLRPAGDGRPRLFFLRDSLVLRDPALVTAHKPTCTVEEWDGYIWTVTPEGKPIKETPRKVDDHGMDMIRYLVMHLDAPRFSAVNRPAQEYPY